MVKLPPKARVWFVFETVWRDFAFVLTNGKACPFLRGKWGYTDLDAGIVYLEESAPEKTLISVAFHEMMHVIFGTPSDHVLLAGLLGCTEKNVDAREEGLIAHTAPRLADAFMRSGLLNFPPIPKSNQ